MSQEQTQDIPRDCPLCGHRFRMTDAGCGVCPLHASCTVTCCPRCHYTFVDDSATTSFVRRLVHRFCARFRRPDGMPV